MDGYYGPTNLGSIGRNIMSPNLKLKRFSQNGVGMIQNLFLLSRNSVVEFFSDTEAVIGSNPIVTT